MNHLPRLLLFLLPLIFCGSIFGQISSVPAAPTIIEQQREAKVVTFQGAPFVGANQIVVFYSQATSSHLNSETEGTTSAILSIHPPSEEDRADGESISLVTAFYDFRASGPQVFAKVVHLQVPPGSTEPHLANVINDEEHVPEEMDVTSLVFRMESGYTVTSGFSTGWSHGSGWFIINVPAIPPPQVVDTFINVDGTASGVVAIPNTSYSEVGDNGTTSVLSLTVMAPLAGAGSAGQGSLETVAGWAQLELGEYTPQGYPATVTITPPSTDYSHFGTYRYRVALDENGLWSRVVEVRLHARLGMDSAPITFSPAPLSFTFNGEPQGPSANPSAANALFDVVWSSGTMPTNAGTYTVTFVAKDGFTGLAGPVEFTILPKAITVTAASPQKVYDGTPIAIGSPTVDGLVAGDFITDYSGTETAGPDAGSYVTSVSDFSSSFGASNYAATYANGSATIHQRPVAVTADSPSKEFDGTPLAVGAPHAGNLLPGVEVVGFVGTSSVGPNAGSYETNVESVTLSAAGDNYSFSFAAGVAQILPRSSEVRVTAASASKEFDGQPLPIGAPSVTGLVGGDSLLAHTGTMSVGPTSGVHPSSVTAIQTAYGADNYGNIVFVDGEGVITPRAAPLIITAASSAKVYDGSPLEIGHPEVSGLVAGDALVSFQGTLVAGPHAGEHVTAVTAVQTSSGIENYANISFVNGVGLIERAPATVTASSVSKEYDGTPLSVPAPEVSGLAAGDSLTAYTGVTQVGPGVGNYVSSVASVEITNGASNYSISYVEGQASILRRSLVVRAHDITVPLDQDTPPLTYEIDASGFAPGDDSTAVDGVPSLTTTRVRNVGPSGVIYPIEVSIGSLSSDNYTFALQNGTLTVGPALLNPHAEISVARVGNWGSLPDESTEHEITWASVDVDGVEIRLVRESDGSSQLLSTATSGELTVSLAPGAYTIALTGTNLASQEDHSVPVAVYYQPNFSLAAPGPYVLFSGPTTLTFSVLHGPAVTDYQWNINGEPFALTGPTLPVLVGDIGTGVYTVIVSLAPDPATYRLASPVAAVAITLCVADLSFDEPTDTHVPLDLNLRWATVNLADATITLRRQPAGDTLYSIPRTDPAFHAHSRLERVTLEGVYHATLEYTLPDGSAGLREAFISLTEPRVTSLKMGGDNKTFMQDQKNRGKSSFVVKGSDR